jgi:hypothetical protein
MSGGIDLSFSRGCITFDPDGTVFVGLDHLAYPYAQPQPYFQYREGTSGDYCTLTTNGVQLLADLTTQLRRPVLVRAGYLLLCQLLISPGGLTISDFARDETRLNINRGVVVRLNEDRFGLKAQSAISFSSTYHGIKFVPAAEIGDEFEDFR